MVRAALVGALLLVLAVPSMAATYLGNLVSRSPADTGGVYRRSVNDTLTVTLVYQNVGINDWSATSSRSGYVVVAAFDSNLTTPTPSALAFNWLGTTLISTITPGQIIGLANDPARETALWTRWTAPGDDGWSGRATAYDIRYSRTLMTAATWVNATRVTNLPTPSMGGTRDSCRVFGLSPSTSYWMAIMARDEVGNWSTISNIASCTTLTSMAQVRIPLRMPSVAGRYSLTCALVLGATNQVISSGLRLNFDVVGGSPPPPPPTTSVDPVPFAGQLTRDLQADIGFWNRGNDEIRIAVTDTTQRRFLPTTTLSWPTIHSADTLLVRQFAGDSLADLCFHLPNGEWYVATNGGGNFTPSATPFLRGFGANRQPVAGDFNADGLCDVGYFNPDSLAYYVALNRNGRFDPVNGPAAGGAWIVWNTTLPRPFRPMTGRFNADRYEDVGFRNQTRAEWFVGMSNGAKFLLSSGSQADGSWLAHWPMDADNSRGLIGRVNADTLEDLVTIQSSGAVKVARSSGTGFVTLNDWLTGWTPDSLSRRSFLIDLSGDRLTELVSFSATAGSWSVARNTGSAFQPWNGSNGNNAWLTGFGQRVVTTTLDAPPMGPHVHLRLLSRNPFTTSITIGGAVVPGQVSITVHDLQGRVVDRAEESHAGGFWNWTWMPQYQQPGVYHLVCTFGGARAVTRVVYLR